MIRIYARQCGFTTLNGLVTNGRWATRRCSEVDSNPALGGSAGRKSGRTFWDTSPRPPMTRDPSSARVVRPRIGPKATRMSKSSFVETDPNGSARAIVVWPGMDGSEEFRHVRIGEGAGVGLW